MENKTALNIKFHLKDYLKLGISLILVVAVQSFLIRSLSDYSLLILIGFNFFLLISIGYYSSFTNIPTFLIIINLTPLIFLNNEFHYYFHWVIIQDLPLFLLFGISIANFLYFEKSYSFDLSYLKLPLFLLFVYIIAMTGIGILNGNNPNFIFHELQHLLYYPFAIAILYTIRERKYYEIIFVVIIIIGLVVAIEYAGIYFMSNIKRYVSFQSGIFLLVIGLLLAKLLIGKNSLFLKISLSTLLLIVSIGVFLSLTRALWISAILTITVTGILWLHLTKNLSLKKVLLFISLLFIPVMWLIIYSGVMTPSRQDQSSVEYRTKSISRPTEDKSLLMRIELGYYIIQEVIKNPIFGKGLGDDIRYVILSRNPEPINYPDNSWLFFLWKGGIVGLILMIWIFKRFLSQAYYILINTTNNTTRIIVLGLLAGFIGFLFYGLFTAFLIKYKSTVIIALAIAYVEYERRELDQSN